MVGLLNLETSVSVLKGSEGTWDLSFPNACCWCKPEMTLWLETRSLRAKEGQLENWKGEEDESEGTHCGCRGLGCVRPQVHVLLIEGQKGSK